MIHYMDNVFSHVHEPMVDGMATYNDTKYQVYDRLSIDNMRAIIWILLYAIAR